MMDATLVPVVVATVSAVLGPAGVFLLTARAGRRKEARDAAREAAKAGDASDEAVRKELWAEVRQLKVENEAMRKTQAQESERCRQVERDAADLRVAVARLEGMRDERDAWIKRSLTLEQAYLDLRALALGTGRQDRPPEGAPR